jgi:hypothetical protein
MTIEQARQEHPEDALFTVKGYREQSGIKDEHWCYVWHVKDPLSAKRKPLSLTAVDEADRSPFVTREETCRMAWFSFLRFEYLNHELTLQEIDRIIGRFQKDGRL